MKHTEIDAIFQKLENDLAQLREKEANLFIRYETAAGLCRMALDELRKLVIKTDFENEKEEIHFFKHVKPQLLSKFLFYVRLVEIETQRNHTSRKYQIKYLKQMLRKLEKYFDQNISFCGYYWGDKTKHDELYFLRKNANSRVKVNNLCITMDSKFSTAYDIEAAKITAYEKLIKHIETEIGVLEFGKKYGQASIQTNLKWTGLNVNLIELLYALKSSGCINNGNIEIKELVAVFENVLNIKLEDYYRVFLDIKGRKKSKTRFLDKLKQDLLRRINYPDESPPEIIN